MKRSPLRTPALPVVLFLLVQASFFALTAYSQEPIPETVRIVAPDRVSTPLLSKPKATAPIANVVYHDDLMEKIGEQGDFYQVRMPEDKTTEGFIPKEFTRPVEDVGQGGGLPVMWIAVAAALVAVIAAIAFVLLRSGKEQAAGKSHSAAISNTVRQAEGLFRAGDFAEARIEYQRYLNLQGGEPLNPDVFRRLTVCARKTEDVESAVEYWKKMRDMGGLRGMDDYTLGVELMMELGEEASAASIYEQLLNHEEDPEKRFEIYRRLFEIFRRLRQPEKLLSYAVELLSAEDPDPEILAGTVSFLIQERKSDLVVESGNKQILSAIKDEFLDEKIMTPEAKRVYVRCLGFEPTNLALHRIMVDIHKAEGDFISAVSELTMLHQLDKAGDRAKYIEEAGQIHVENSLVAEAISQGNPAIIKKIAQMYLARSHVTPDAVAIYEKVLEIQPDAVGINKMLRTVYLTRGDLDNYMAGLKHLHEIDGANHDYLGELAKCVIANDLFEQTLKEGNRELNARVLKMMIKKGANDPKSISLFERLIKYEPKSVPIRRTLAEAYESSGDKERALKQLIALCELRPEDEGTLDKAVGIAVDDGMLQPVVDLGKGKVLARVAKGLIKNRAKDDLSRKVLEKAFAENPKSSGIKKYLDAIGASAG